MRRIGSGAVAATLLVSTPWLGWWTLVVIALAAINLASVERRIAHSRRPERVTVSALAITLALLGAAVALSGGPTSPTLPWLILPAAVVAARFRPQVAAAAVTLTAVVIVTVTLGLHTSATLRHPVAPLATLALLTAVLSIVWALESAELYQRDRATVDPLTGLANRRQFAHDLNAVLRQATIEHPVRLLLFDLEGFKSYNDNFGHLGGDLLLGRLARAFEQAVGAHGRAYRLGGDELCALLRGDSGETIVGDCLQALSADGEGFTITCSYGAVMLPAEAFDADAALQLADERMYAHKDASRASAGKQTRDLALQMLAAHEPVLHAHASHVAELAQGVARRLGLTGVDLADTVRAAELHDIGKVAIPYAVLHKAGPLDEQEWELMRRHPTIGASILSAAPALARVAQIVGATHERYDGTGYPRGLAGESIPLASRIVFVCDSFDAMISRRPFGEAKSELDALRELRRCAGTQFDPSVVEAFVIEHAARRARAGKAPGSSASNGDCAHANGRGRAAAASA